MMVFAAFATLSLVATSASASDLHQGLAKPWQLGFQDAATPVMEQIAGLHDYLLWISVIVSLVVLLLMIYVGIRFSRKNNPIPSKTSHNTLVEIVWTIIPILILVSIAIPSWRTHYYMDKAAEPDMTLKIVGYQWYWGYEYVDYDGLEFKAYIKKDDELGADDVRLLSTDKPVVVPVNKTVRVLGTSEDVIHSWAMPAFGVKQDTVPGRLNETWFRAEKTGIYYGQCSELCGVNHGFMPIEIRVVEQDVFDRWIARAKNGEFSLHGLDIPGDIVKTATAEETNTSPEDVTSSDEQIEKIGE